MSFQVTALHVRPPLPRLLHQPNPTARSNARLFPCSRTEYFRGSGVQLTPHPPRPKWRPTLTGARVMLGPATPSTRTAQNIYQNRVPVVPFPPTGTISSHLRPTPDLALVRKVSQRRPSPIPELPSLLLPRALRKKDKKPGSVPVGWAERTTGPSRGLGSNAGGLQCHGGQFGHCGSGRG